VRHNLQGGAAVALLAIAAAGVTVRATEGDWRNKVHPEVFRQRELGRDECILILDDQADLSAAATKVGRIARGRFVFEGLRQLAARTQRPIIERLDSLDLEYRSFWIANMIWVRGAGDKLEELALRPDVRRVEANPRVRKETAPKIESAIAKGAGTIEWNVQRIGADELWLMGYDGQGIVIGGQDTGYDWDHPALRDSYRGWLGNGVDHDYAWHDSIHSGGGSCGSNSAEPCDDTNHGTHTMGSMVGDDGGSNRIGVSPGATWIGCRNMDQGDGTPIRYAECFQWFVAPTDKNGDNPDPTLAPHVINNSWVCPPSEGCGAATLRTVVSNTRAAGIVVVVSAGNEGAGCESVLYPPATYDESLSVGATNSFDTVASFSSRGPVTVDGSGRLKPDVSAPGVGVRSSIPGGAYAVFSGTSMAGPHVAGAVALLLDALPSLEGDVDAIEQILKASATPRASSQTCGGVLGTEIPNHTYGYGTIDVAEAVTGDADGDARSNLDDCALVDPTLWSAPSAVSDLGLAYGGAVELSWSPPGSSGGTQLVYDVLKSPIAANFENATCVASDSTEATASDPLPDKGLRFYLVRVKNECGSATGRASAGERSMTVCP
jgi:subtilisin family serine protease